jgi:hypothetical protein
VKLVVLGLSLSSSWGNGHATTYRALLKAFAERGHDILFLERDVPWYAAHRDLDPDFCRLAFYDASPTSSAGEAQIAQADAVIVGSYVPDGVAVGEWVLANAGGVKGLLRHRHAGHPGQSREGRPGLPVGQPDRALRSLPVVHRRPDLGPHRANLRLAGGPRALLLGRRRPLPADRDAQALGSQLSGNLQSSTGNRSWSACCWSPPAARRT